MAAGKPSFLTAAAAALMVHLGAAPILVHILPESWCLDPEQVEEAKGGCTRLILLSSWVELGGVS